jgi:uncharacterized membrane protein
MNILYCGDQDNAPLYIAGALEHAGHEVTHIPPNEPLPNVMQFDVFILSDYPASGLTPVDCESVIQQVASGKRLLMLGGWESFNGFGRNYYSNPIGQILPVELRDGDDRVNAFQGLIVSGRKRGRASEPDWAKPPIICGYNDAKAKHAAEVLVEMLPIKASLHGIEFGSSLPLVVKGVYQQGTVVACLTDLAPHWSGGLTDWGSKTIALTSGIEVGDSFLKLVQFLLRA